MSEYVIITDSGADLTQEMAEELDVQVLPLSFTIRGTTLQDRPDHRDMSSQEFYRLIREGEMPTTSAVNVQQYLDLLTPILEGGRDVLILSFDSGISATYQSSFLAAQELQKQFPDRRIYAVDTLCATLGQAMLVRLAVERKRAGADLDGLRAWVEENKRKVCTWFTPNDLMHLKRGGRVSATTAVVGTMLQIKPILHVTNEGKLDTVDKARGRKASLDYLVKRVADTAIEPERNPVYIAHTECLEDARYVAGRLREELHVPEVVIGYVGTVIGSHLGCGAIVVNFLGTER